MKIGARVQIPLSPPKIIATLLGGYYFLRKRDLNHERERAPSVTRQGATEKQCNALFRLSSNRATRGRLPDCWLRQRGVGAFFIGGKEDLNRERERAIELVFLSLRPYGTPPSSEGGKTGRRGRRPLQG